MTALPFLPLPLLQVFQATSFQQGQAQLLGNCEGLWPGRGRLLGPGKLTPTAFTLSLSHWALALVPSEAETQPLRASDPESQALCLPGFHRGGLPPSPPLAKGSREWQEGGRGTALRGVSSSLPSAVLHGSCSYNAIRGSTGCAWVRGEGHPGEGQPCVRECVHAHTQKGWEGGTQTKRKTRASGERVGEPGEGQFRVTGKQFLQGCVETLRHSQWDLRDTGKGVRSWRRPKSRMGTQSGAGLDLAGGREGPFARHWELSLAFLPHPRLERSVSPLVSRLLASPGASQ